MRLEQHQNKRLRLWERNWPFI